MEHTLPVGAERRRLSVPVCILLIVGMSLVGWAAVLAIGAGALLVMR